MDENSESHPEEKESTTRIDEPQASDVRQGATPFKDWARTLDPKGLSEVDFARLIDARETRVAEKISSLAKSASEYDPKIREDAYKNGITWEGYIDKHLKGHPNENEIRTDHCFHALMDHMQKYVTCLHQISKSIFRKPEDSPEFMEGMSLFWGIYHVKVVGVRQSICYLYSLKSPEPSEYMSERHYCGVPLSEESWQHFSQLSLILPQCTQLEPEDPVPQEEETNMSAEDIAEVRTEMAENRKVSFADSVDV